MRRSVPAATWCLSLLPRPVGQPWLGWNRETTYVRHESPEAGVFESWLDVTWSVIGNFPWQAFGISI